MVWIVTSYDYWGTCNNRSDNDTQSKPKRAQEGEGERRLKTARRQSRKQIVSCHQFTRHRPHYQLVSSPMNLPMSLLFQKIMVLIMMLTALPCVIQNGHDGGSRRIGCVHSFVVPSPVTVMPKRSFGTTTHGDGMNHALWKNSEGKFPTSSSIKTGKRREERVRLHGIKGFRGWFESQFPSAITNIPRKPPPNSKRRNHGTSSSSSTTASSKKTKQPKVVLPEVQHHDTFDHVLIDMNQLLHTTLRRARSEGHALTMLMKELDSCLDISRPTKSVVLAMDGPPGAAKLATQRIRRYNVVSRAAWKKQRKTGNSSFSTAATDDHQNGSAATKKKKKRGKKRLFDHDDMATLCITPGTSFMKRANEALLYWAWQRLSNPYSTLRRHGVKIYISSSDTPGEGEVKLLDWINSNSHHSATSARKKKQAKIQLNDSIALWGGDSDLVLEGLILNCEKITHNVFILIPESYGKCFSVSLWEVTRTLVRFFPNLDSTVENVMKLRVDLVVLLILNGNDYLPKLRGSAGFHKLFHMYLSLLKTFYDKDENGETENNDVQPFFLTHNNDHDENNPDSSSSLSWNLPFAYAFFSKLAKYAPRELPNTDDMLPYSKSITPLSNLHRMMDGGWLPKPAVFTVIADNNAEGHETVRLTLGLDGTEQQHLGHDNNNTNALVTTSTNHSFEVDHREGANLKTAKHRLAFIALETLLGPEGVSGINMDIYGDNASDDEQDDDDDDAPNKIDETDAWHTESDNNNNTTSSFDNDNGASFTAASYPKGYSWEVQRPVPANVKSYLTGLLWNLQTYHDGVCADYAYNYGRRMSPTARQLADYIHDAMHNGSNNTTDNNNETLGRLDISSLLDKDFTSPLNAGLSCLAALPSKAKHLVPHPYNLLTNNDMVEDIYGICMCNSTNVFDLDKFRTVCEDQIEELLSLENSNTNENDHEPSLNDGDAPSSSSSNNTAINGFGFGRTIHTSSKYWTVLSFSALDLEHAFAPPLPFSDRLSPLEPSQRIRASRLLATHEPKWRRTPPNNKNVNHVEDRQTISSFVNKPPPEFSVNGDMKIDTNDNRFKEKTTDEEEKRERISSVLDIPYKRAYIQHTKQHQQQIKDKKHQPSSLMNNNLTGGDEEHHRHKHRKKQALAALATTNTKSSPLVAKQKIATKSTTNPSNATDTPTSIAFLKETEPLLPPSPLVLPTNANNYTPLSCLQCLADDGYFFYPTFNWTVIPHHNSKGKVSAEMETIQLCLALSDNATTTVAMAANNGQQQPQQQRFYKIQRNMSAIKRKECKHKIAIMVLQEFIGENWEILSIEGMKKVMKEKT